MATGGRDGYTSDTSLDLSELESELQAWGEERDSTNDSLLWEEQKAQTEYEIIEAETSSELDFSGFHTPTQSPSKSDVTESLSTVNLSVPSTLKTPHVHLYSRSAPTSPLPDWSSLSIQQRINSFESLTQAQTQTKLHLPKKKTKSKASPKPKKSTRLALKKGHVSPLAKAGSFYRKRTRVRNRLVPINTMAQANIVLAGRLNPRNRNIGGVGDTLASLNFPVLVTDGIPAAGKNILREFVPLRTNIVADANLVLAEAGDATACKESLVDYIADVANRRERFNKVMESIVVENVNAEAAINEIIKVEGELQGLMRACKIRIASRLASGAAAPGDQVKLVRLDFPEFSGLGNYKTWNTNFDSLAVHVASEEAKKSHLLKALTGNAKTYIVNTMTSSSTFNDIKVMLNNRYNDPISVNYNLLHRVFNSPDLAKPQSTQAHWDSAVGDIKAIQESGLGIGEVLVYYRLHKFEPEFVRRVRDRHKIEHPGKASINLDEAISIINKITAEEAKLTEDTISVEQCIQNLTLTATPKVSQYTKFTPQTQPHFTGTPQTESRSLPYRGAGSKGGNRGGKWGGSNSVNNTPPQLYCHMCDSRDHSSHQCPNFTTPAARRAELSRINRCIECALKLKSGVHHYCPYFLKCNCGGLHKKWLCTDRNNNAVVSQGQNLSLGASGTGSQNNSSLTR